MFSSLRIKLQSLLQPLHRRSASICVESKAKKIASKRDHSLTKTNRACLPEQVEFTPRKKTSTQVQRNSLDELETAVKDQGERAGTRMISNGDRKWLDFVSDIDEVESDRLLPSSQEVKGQTRFKQSSLEANYRGQDKKEAKIGSRREKKIEGDCKCPQNGTQPQNTLINWLQQNKPEYFMIKLNPETSKKAHQIKKRRQQQLEAHKRYTLIKSKLICNICHEPASIKQSMQLACAHRIHRLCADIVKWKPRMKCMLCERRLCDEVLLAKPRKEKSRFLEGLEEL